MIAYDDLSSVVVLPVVFLLGLLFLATLCFLFRDGE